MKYEPLRHPLIFYFGHTATFFINKMHLAGLCERVNPAYETAFAVGVDEMDWDDLDEAHYDFPSMKDLQAYRDLVKQVVLKWIKENHTDGQRVTWNSPSWIVVMGIEHEKVHIETSSVLIRTVELSKVKPNAALPICTNARSDISSVPQNSLVPVKGIDRDWPKQVSNTKAYGWDLEFGTKHLECKDFKASKFLVSNAEFFEFVKVGGYGKGEFWEEEGKHWLKSCRKNHPFFWVKTG